MNAGQLRWMIDYLRDPKGAEGSQWGRIIGSASTYVVWMPPNVPTITPATLALFMAKKPGGMR
jgi:hypothetical protein